MVAIDYRLDVMSLTKNIQKLLVTSAILYSFMHPSMAQDATVGDFTKLDAIAIKTLSVYARSNASWDKTSYALERVYNSQDPQGDGISHDERDIKTLTQNASSRATMINNWLRLDLDGDGSITEKELREISNRPLNTQRISNLRKPPVIKPTQEQAEEIYQAIKEGAKLPDLDGDGTTTIDEMLEQSRNNLAERKSYSRVRNKIAFDYDVNKNGIITKDEYLGVLKSVFAKFDSDKDGTLTLKDAQRLRDVGILTRVLLKPKQ